MLWSLLSNCSCKTYAVLMAGSRGYQNYRHQSDVYRFYNILTSRGMKDEDIITISYDDVVDSERNRYPGQVFNTADHVNVYPGKEKIDYSGKDANAETFMRVLTGDDRHGRALKSTSSDDLLIYYCDHGSNGLLAVPENNGPEIYADHLAKTFQTMYEKKMYKNILFIIEACYSGSVAKVINIPNCLTIAAAAGIQSSYSADWDNELSTYRTNEFTKNVINSVLSKPSQTVLEMVNDVSNNTKRSHVTAFGDFAVGKLPLKTFMMSAEPVEIQNNYPGFGTNGAPDKSLVEMLEGLAASNKTYELLLRDELRRRKEAKRIFNDIAVTIDPVNGGKLESEFVNDIKFDCYRTSVEGFRLFCGEVDEYELPKLNIFAGLCRRYGIDIILEQIKRLCPKPVWNPVYM